MKDAKDAQIMLADIPFVRMTQNQLQFVFDKNMTFSQAVAHIQKMLSGGVKLTLNVTRREVMIGDVTKFILPAAQFCIYVVMAKRTIEGKITEFSEAGSLDFALDFVHFYQYYQDDLRGHSRDAQEERKYKVADLQYLPKGKKRSEIKRIFDESSSNIVKKFLLQHLGEYGLRFAIKSEGKNNAKTYYLDIEPHLIEIIE